MTPQIEAKIYYWTNIFIYSDHRLQRSKHGSNYARPSEQQHMLALLMLENIAIRGERKSCPNVVKTTHNFFSTSFERKYYSCCPLIGLAYEPIPYCSSCQIWLAMRYRPLLSDLPTFFSGGQVLEQM